MSKSSSSGLHDADLTNPDKRRRMLYEVSAVRGVNKSGLAHCLRLLHARGYLKDPLIATPSHSSYRKSIQKAVELDGLQVWTPYGFIIQEMALELECMPTLHYVNPFSLVYHLCSKFATFFHLLRDTVQRCSGALRIIIYLDGITPGNPLHPDPQRCLSAIYWTFAEFPSWFLQRKDAWFIFGLSRTLRIQELEGGVSEFCDKVLHIFFPKTGLSWSEGVSLLNGDNAVVVTAEFLGFLGDEKQLKEILDITGQAGSYPCFNHINTVNRWVAVDGSKFKHWDPDRRALVKLTADHLEQKIVRLRESTRAHLKRRQTLFGVNRNEKGLLFNDDTRRRIVRTETVYIRDHMHTLTSNGVAGTHLALLMQTLATLGIACSVVRTYAQKFIFPRHLGKVSHMYFQEGLMFTDHVKQFASDVLGMMTIMNAFLIEKIQVRGWIPQHIECFLALYKVVCIIRRGTMDIEIHNRLTKIVDRHARLFLDLYGNKHAKIKFHHLYDLPDDLFAVGKAVGCYVTERKNKDALDFANGISRHIERTAICGFLQRSLRTWEEHPEICMPLYMIKARWDIEQQVLRSDEALLPCGKIFTHDLVVTSSSNVAKVLSFWQLPDCEDIYVQLHAYEKVPEMPLRWRKSASNIELRDVSSIIEAVSYYEPSPDLVVVAMPLT